MGLLQNGFRDTCGVCQTFGATQSNNAYPSANWANYARTGAMRNITAGQGITDGTVSLPSGNRHPSAWMMPQKAGALAARNSLTGSGEVSDADVWAVKLAQAAITGAGDLTATGGLIVQLVAAVTGNGTVSDADLKAFLQLAAALSGSGVAAGDGSGLGALLAALTGASDLDATLTGTGAMAADIVVTGTGLSTANVGEAVWSALAAANNTAGTMGEKLNDAGSASNPWTEVIESGYTAAEILRLLAAVAQGDASGLEGSAPVFKSIDGTTDRVTATYSEGTRTITGRDAS